MTKQIVINVSDELSDVFTEKKIGEILRQYTKNVTPRIFVEGFDNTTIDLYQETVYSDVEATPELYNRMRKHQKKTGDTVESQLKKGLAKYGYRA